MTSTTKSKLKLLRLIVVFILLVIAAIYVVKYASNRIKEKKSDDVVANMLIIQGKLKVINGKSKVNNSDEWYIGIKISDVHDEDFIRKINDIGITEEIYDEYYLLNKEHFEIMQLTDDLKNVDNNEYIVNYKQCEVVYVEGINIDGSTKYKLSDIEKKSKKPEFILYNQIKI